MKQKKLHVLIIVLLTSLLAAKCDCANNPKKLNENKTLKGQKKGKKSIDVRKQGEFIMEKLGADKLEELKEKKKLGQKPQKKHKPVGNDPVEKSKEQDKQQKLAQLVNEEKNLFNKARKAVDQLEKDTNFLPELFGEESPLLSFDKKFMDDLIRDCKDDPKLTNAAVDFVEKFQSALGNFQQALPTFRNTKPSLKELANVLLKSAGISMDEAQELFGAELFDQEEFRAIEQELSQPIDPDQLDEQEKKMYDRIVQKYPSAAQSGWNLCCAFLENFLPSLQNAVDTHLDLLKNIQEQNQLEEWEE